MEPINKQRPRLILFYLLLAFLLAPFLQYKLNIVRNVPLNGGVSNMAHAAFSWSSWWNGDYQKQMTNHLNDSTGFRTGLVRLNNELDFLLFKKLHANGVVLGKNSYLYEKRYIEVHYGENYTSDTVLRRKLQELKYIQDTLEKLHKTFLFICAPSKADYYPEFIPADLVAEKKAHDAYHDFIHLADSLHIHMIDANGWFMKMKDTTRQILFSQHGIHWTYYGALLAADSLVRYLTLNSGYTMPHIVIDKLGTTTVGHEQEDDIMKGLNLMVPFAHGRYTDISYHFTNVPKDRMPKMIFHGDSFNWTFIYDKVPQSISSKWEYWNYFFEVYRDTDDEGMRTYNWGKALSATDCYIMMYTTVNLQTLGDGGIEKIYAYYGGK